jgi:succinate-semialdehyde dehydrogenase/glutarate-semialdehyde dehydrogenase
MAIQSINPATDEVLDTFPETSPEELERMLAGGHDAFLDWRARPFAERSARMHEVARLLRERKDALARMMTLEMGKPIVQGEAEVDKCAGTCDYYAEHAERFLAAEARETDAAKSYVRFDPLGIILAVMPWNFPFWQVFRFAAPALMAGNAGLLKHASNVPQCALAIEDIFKAAGFPPGLFRTALIGSSAVGGLIADARFFARHTGPAMSAFNAWLLSKSLETLAVRMDRHCQSALKLAQHFEGHAGLESVRYPGLPSHPQFALAQKQMSQGG